MALRVPEEYIEHIQGLLGLPEQKIQEFLDTLAQTGPAFNVYDLAAEVSTRTELPLGLTQGIMQVLNSLYLTRERQSTPLAAFVDETITALQSALSLPVETADAQLAKLRRFLLVALSLDSTVGTASKAGRVLTEHERIFVEARIMTDIRPIFHPDLSEQPNAAILIHMLRITQRDAFRKQQSLYFALDANDLRSLKALVDRAIKKEETARTMMAPGVNILTPKEIY
jgi:hypothetical protein